MISSVLAWPKRRWVAAAVLAPVVAAVLFAAGGTPGAGGASPAWPVLVLVAAALGAGVLASYLPATGRGLELGCSPCAVMSGLTLVGATMAMRNYGADLAGPLVAAAILLFGLTQRLSQPATCATDPR